MPREIILPTHRDSRGMLTVIEKEVSFSIKRVYYIYGCNDAPRGGHCHKKTIQALICISGSCIVDWKNTKEKGSVELSSPDKMLILQPEDYHIMKNFSSDAILLVLASELHDPEDYIYIQDHFKTELLNE